MLAYFAGPYTTTGKYGNAIMIPNNGAQDDNAIRMGAHSNSCFGNLNLCFNGATFSLWFKFGAETITQTTSIFQAPYLHIFTEDKKGEVKVRLETSNGTHLRRFFSLPAFAPGEWHLIGITYSKISDFTVRNIK